MPQVIIPQQYLYWLPLLAWSLFLQQTFRSQCCSGNSVIQAAPQMLKCCIHLKSDAQRVIVVHLNAKCH